MNNPELLVEGQFATFLPLRGVTHKERVLIWYWKRFVELLIIPVL